MSSEYGLQKLLDGKYEFVLAARIDKDRVYDHLMFNAISFSDYNCYHPNKQGLVICYSICYNIKGCIYMTFSEILKHIRKQQNYT